MKILPATFAADADRLMRFERKAKTLAALNHPNIAQIYGLETSGAMRALVIGTRLPHRTGARPCQ